MIPATGVRAPARTFVAVRAIAPVAEIPPSNGQAMFARPWPINSVFESCRASIIPSATIADNNDSIAPSIAIVSDGSINSWINPKEISGNATSGNPRGIPPNFDPIVATGNCNTATNPVVTTNATTEAGTRAHRFGHATKIPTANDPKPSADQFTSAR